MFTLSNRNGLAATFLARGATLVELLVPDRQGNRGNVVLGFDDLAGYESGANQYFGCTVGRVANRIARGRFRLDGREYRLAVNEPPNHLHGGGAGSFDKASWHAEQLGPAAIRFTHASPDGEEGYPGHVQAAVDYTLTEQGELVIDFKVNTDQATPINLTNHSYFNLGGAGMETVLDHILEVGADDYTPTDETLIPTGQLAPVRGTPLDFTTPRRLRDSVLALTGTAAQGLDHNFAIRSFEPGRCRFAARLSDPASGRTLTVYTDQPGIQAYTGNHLKGRTGRDGKTYLPRSAICLETQLFPDAVNQPAFLSPVLRPGAVYRHRCIYAFAVDG